MIVHERPENSPIVLSSLWVSEKGKDDLTCPYCGFQYVPRSEKEVFVYCPNCARTLREKNSVIFY